MKKILTILFSAFLLVGCAKKSETTVTPTSGPREITKIQSTVADMSGYRFLKDKEPAFDLISLKDSIQLIDDKDTAILYYGYTGCPWCQRAVPVLNDAAKEAGIRVYYVNAAVQPNKDEYNNLLNRFDSVLKTDGNGKKSFLVPFVVAVRDGRIMGSHLSLVDGFKLEDDNSQLTEQQATELKNIYIDLINKAIK